MLAYIATLVLLCGTRGLLSQTDTDQHGVSFTIPSIALLDIEPSNSGIALSLTAPTEAGAPPTTSASATDNSKWLNYTSALPTGSTRRTISAQITSGTLPAGLRLNLSTAAYSGSGAGSLGSPVGSVMLSNVAQTIVTNIGASYTGNGSSNGHRLTYVLEILNVAQLNAGNSGMLQVTFTIND